MKLNDKKRGSVLGLQINANIVARLPQRPANAFGYNETVCTKNRVIMHRVVDVPDRATEPIVLIQCASSSERVIVYGAHGDTVFTGRVDWLLIAMAQTVQYLVEQSEASRIGRFGAQSGRNVTCIAGRISPNQRLSGLVQVGGALRPNRAAFRLGQQDLAPLLLMARAWAPRLTFYPVRWD